MAKTFSQAMSSWRRGVSLRRGREDPRWEVRDTSGHSRFFTADDGIAIASREYFEGVKDPAAIAAAFTQLNEILA